MNARALLLAVLLGVASAAAFAQCSHTDFLHDLGMRESRLDPSARNPFGYIGLFQPLMDRRDLLLWHSTVHIHPWIERFAVRGTCQAKWNGSH